MARTPRTAPVATPLKATFNKQHIALSKLKPHPENPRIHPDKGTPDWEVLKASLAHDYFDPLVWNKINGMLVSGHFRLKVMEDMGYVSADVVVVEYDENTHKARLLAANRLLGEDDEVKQKAMLEELLGVKFDMGVAGFSFEDLEVLGVGAQDSPNPGANVPPSSGAGLNQSASAVRYVQLIYTAENFDKVRALLDGIRTSERAALSKKFGDDASDPANVVWHVLEQFAKTTKKK